MSSTIERDRDEEYSEIGDKGDIGFLDFEDDKSFCSFNPTETGPVVIPTPFPFIAGKPRSVVLGEVSSDSICIKNTTDEPVELWSIRIFSSIPEDSYHLSLMKPPAANADEREIDAFVDSDALEDRVLQPRQSLTIWLSCRPKEIGLHTSVVHFDVGFDKIERVVFLLADDKVSQALVCKKPYFRGPRRRMLFECDNYVAGFRPHRPATQSSSYNLPEYAIPKEIRELVEAKQIPDVIMEGLNTLNYARFFSSLINIEEIHLGVEMRAHDMESVSMRKRGIQFLSLEVPGLAERRPSLVQGDFIFVKLATENSDSSRPYKGYIHKVEADEILLRFDKKLHQCHRDDHLYNISFTYNRVNMRRLYHTVQAAEGLGPEILFPIQLANRRVINTVPFQPLSPSLNREQMHSVEMILGCKGFPPYVIHGPPGTGKTMTLVEAILQLYTTRRKARILVCASSNSAADHVLEKLLARDVDGVRQTEIFRLNATSRPREDIKSDFVTFCFFEDTTFKCPPLKALLRYRIIISTYMSSFLLHAEGIRKGHFSHIFLDEAGQASEPETMVPISTLSEKDTVIVLAGDPMQLGPVVYSSIAESHGLGKSYLERLFEFEYYEGGDENYVTKLLRNYRNHPSILELPSRTFYKGELIACKDDDDESSIYDGIKLPNKTFPVLFVGIQGCDEREGSNPSWFNRIEASKAVDIIRKLLSNPDLNEADIGVITPYRQQVLKLQNGLELLEVRDIKVGSVEQFQGQEKKIIIVSTVRSTIKHNEFDRMYSLGFLSNPRRFNVAITRARSLLIIIGNPHIIAKDPYWEMLLRHCVDNGSYQGCPLPPLEMEYFRRPFSPQFLPQKPNSEGFQCGEDSLQCFKRVEWGDEATELYNNNDDEDVELGEYIEHQNEGEWLRNDSKFSSNKYDSADSSAWNDSSIDHYGSTEAEATDETNNFDGTGHECSTPFKMEIEWKGMTCTSTGWD